jgi:hypothetical protein
MMAQVMTQLGATALASTPALTPSSSAGVSTSTSPMSTSGRCESSGWQAAKAYAQEPSPLAMMTDCDSAVLSLMPKPRMMLRAPRSEAGSVAAVRRRAAGGGRASGGSLEDRYEDSAAAYSRRH